MLGRASLLLDATARAAHPAPPRRLPCPAPPPALTEVQREQKKAEKLIKEAAKRNDLVSAKVGGGVCGWLSGVWGSQRGRRRVPAVASSSDSPEP